VTGTMGGRGGREDVARALIAPKRPER
jgi:hypothetical protein